MEGLSRRSHCVPVRCICVRFETKVARPYKCSRSLTKGNGVEIKRLRPSVKRGGERPIETEYNEQHSKPIDSFRPNIATFQRVWQLLFFFFFWNGSCCSVPFALDQWRTANWKMEIIIIIMAVQTKPMTSAPGPCGHGPIINYLT